MANESDGCGCVDLLLSGLFLLAVLFALLYFGL